MSKNDNSKITLVGFRISEAPVVKREPQEDEDVAHCFVYDLAKPRGGRCSYDSYIEFPFA
jgi:hypothetical protein